MKTSLMTLVLASVLSACAFNPPKPPLPSGPRIPVNQTQPPVFGQAESIGESL
jgi:hypothetical protein